MILLLVPLQLVLFFLKVGAQSGNTTYDIAAFYWPGYHPELRFKDIHIFPDGKGEWEAIYKAKPKFADEEVPKVPLWGYEDESDPKAMEKKIATAVKYGVNVMIFDWYWYDNRPFLEGALNDGFLKASNTHDMRFCLMWANHDMPAYLDPADPDKSKIYWRGGVDRKTFEGMIKHIINDYFKKENYYTINGEPVFSIYELSTFINGMGGAPQAKEALDYFRRETIKAGFPGLHLQSILWGNVPSGLAGVPSDHAQTQNTTLNYFGFKSMTNYQWVHFVSPGTDYLDWGKKAIGHWAEWDKTFDIPYCPQVSIGWDNNPRFPTEKQPFVKNIKPEYFQYYLQQAKDYIDGHPNQPKLITINAWNEWAEGSMLEPEKKYGFGYLEAVRKVFLKR
ncbi:glycoside hydrolase family 99-like domain-containing protein [Olivibacter ginsenosidimutans]|uniref:Glycoside hydrolase family 99-like domain-containing protein n=2 Tax=Olivibacter ginsenosidimutans TaxID=1176537 RepID=A0ABP9AB33_9SPHI